MQAKGSSSDGIIGAPPPPVSPTQAKSLCADAIIEAMRHFGALHSSGSAGSEPSAVPEPLCSLIQDLWCFVEAIVVRHPDCAFKGEP